ncbi:MAG: hypothetical protein A2117_01795 [Candidatus Wildermuthbacteria bacterium GWA2_46_15]|uniref:Uncharacterized protein n=1 Tax=Candidatus Wildermuthbacteria bacterium GWA2_46_15 TaxID=1802443 RepID=A0A1G2QN84_9BACT|nr:MAG: hypothetical protein A2117_01795 [Candidatus Wildermuthbacteria bacterium GWA2_46_15]
MIRAAEKQNILLQWLSWQFVETPKGILRGWRNILVFNFEYFSIPLLFKTFFAYWRQYRWYYPRSFDIGKYAEVIFSNIISRVLGAIVRSAMIVLGILVEIIIFLIGALVFLVWVLLPALIFFGLWQGIRLFF